MLAGRDPDALTPDVVASRSFGFAKRGYEAREVQDFLREVAEELRVRLDHAAELTRQLEEVQVELEQARQLDEDQLAEALGEETKQVLAAARSAAAGIRTRAEEQAVAIVAQAEADAAEVRAAAAADAERVRAETEAEVAGHLRAAAVTVAEARDEAVATAERATVEAAETVEAARHRGREMVAEAQAVRERMLKDLARRRKVLRQQIDQLQAGRDRLLAAYEIVFRTTAEATGELSEVLDAARDAARAAVAEAGAAEGDVDLDIVAAIEEVRRERGTDPGALTADLELVDEPPSEEVPAVEATDAPDGAPTARDGGDDPSAGATTGDGGPSDDAGAEGAPEAAAGDGTDPVGDPDEPDLAPGDGAAEGEAVDDEPEEAPGRRGKADRRRSLFGRAGEDVPKAPPPAEHEGRFSSAVRVFARGEDGVTVEVVGEVPPADEVPGAAVEGTGSGSEAPPAPEDRAEAAGGLFARLRQEQQAAAVEQAEQAAVEQAEQAAAEQAEQAEQAERSERSAAEGDDGPPGSAAPSTAGPAGEGTEAEDEGEDELGGDDEPPAGDAALLARRDAAVAELVATLRRRLKRTLADEENEVLDALRRHRGPVDADLLLPSAEDHLRRYADAALPTLAASASAGVDFVAAGWPEQVAEAPRTRVGDLAEGAAEDLVVPLRQALARQLAAGGDGSEELVEAVRETYRDWRHTRIEPAADQAALTAFHRAVAEHLVAGTRLRWVVGGPTEPGPDCADNAAADPVVAGEPFPDGSVVPPCGAGCRCLVVPAG